LENKLELIENDIYTSMVPNHDLRVGHRSFYSPEVSTVAHRIIGYVPRSLLKTPWTQIEPRSELHPNFI